MKSPKYRIEAESVYSLAAMLVYLLKLETEQGKLEPNGPRLSWLECVTNCNSKVRITLSKSPKDENVRRGIEIDGVRLG